jgi:hypothetical protein
VTGDRSLRPTDRALLLILAVGIAAWRFVVGESVTAKLAGAVLFGGGVVGVCLRVLGWCVGGSRRDRR